eukprot:gene406-480_t
MHGITVTQCNGNLGGAIHFKDTIATVSNCIFTNSTASKGGAIYVDGGQINVISSIFNWNHAIDGGSAIYQTGKSLSEIDLSDLSCNDGQYALVCDGCSGTIDSTADHETLCTNSGVILDAQRDSVCSKSTNSITTCKRLYNGYEYAVTAYLKVNHKQSYSFRISGVNFGVRMLIDGMLLFEFTTGQTVVNSEREVTLNTNHVHKIQLYIINTKLPQDKQLKLEWKNMLGDNNYRPLSESLFYSNNICGDDIFDPSESNALSKFKCGRDSKGYGASACGDGICDGSPHDCLEDCYDSVSPVCPGQSPPARTSDMYSKQDLVGTLLDNQYIYNLPGLAYLAHGVDYLTNEQKVSPIFTFGYCDNATYSVNQDHYRSLSYTVPNGIFASFSPKCTFETESKTFTSSSHMSSETFHSFNLAGSANARGGGLFVKASASVSFSQEKSVATARELEITSSGSLMTTELQCVHSKVHIASTPEFHPSFVQALANALTLDKMKAVIKKYGLYYIISTDLGGKLVQVHIMKSTKLTETTSIENKESTKASFSANVNSAGMYSASASGSGSLDRSTTNEQQREFESKSESSTLKIYGGPLGSFTPGESYTGETNFNTWATQIDLVPVPVNPHMAHISGIIPSTWLNREGVSISELYLKAEMALVLSHLEPTTSFIAQVPDYVRNKNIYVFDLLDTTLSTLKLNNVNPPMTGVVTMKPFQSNDFGELMSLDLKKADNSDYSAIAEFHVYDVALSRVFRMIKSGTDYASAPAAPNKLRLVYSQFTCPPQAGTPRHINIRIYGDIDTHEELMIDHTRFCTPTTTASKTFEISPSKYLGKIRYISFYLVADRFLVEYTPTLKNLFIHQHCPAPSRTTQTGIESHDPSNDCSPLGLPVQNNGYINAYRGQESQLSLSKSAENYFLNVEPLK